MQANAKLKGEFTFVLRKPRATFNHFIDLGTIPPSGRFPSMDEVAHITELTVVEVVSGDLKQLWVAAAKPEHALTLVLASVPQGWMVKHTGIRLSP